MMITNPPPLFETKQMIWGRELVFWDKNDQNNPFQWQDVRLNLQSPKKYDP